MATGATVIKRSSLFALAIAQLRSKLHWRQQEWFYDDATKDKRAAAMAVLEAWGMVEPAVEAAEQLREHAKRATKRPW
jgi:hypothetical protein